jgi:hypothetical protein
MRISLCFARDGNPWRPVPRGGRIKVVRDACSPISRMVFRTKAAAFIGSPARELEPLSFSCVVALAGCARDPDPSSEARVA